MMSRRTGLLAGALALIGCGARATPSCPALSGRWGGTLQAGGGSLRLVLEVDATGAMTLVSVDQGGARIPATGGSCTPDAIDVQFGAVNGRLEAQMDASGALVGTWRQGSALPLTLRRLAEGQSAPEAPVVVRGPLADELKAAREAAGAPGMAAGWSRGDRTIVHADGVRLAGVAAPVTPSDVWHVGSITKSMTATLVARLVERGLIGWDESVGEAFRPIAPDMDARHAPATLVQLMSGLSGLPTNLPLVQLVGHPRAEADPRDSRIKWTRQALAMAPQNAVGEGFAYPNNGFVLMGALCERRTGKTWETLMREEVFGPLGMTSAGFGPPPAPDPSAPANPVGHRPAMLGGRPVGHGAGPDADNPAALGPAGRAHMTLADLLRFGRAHAAGAAGGAGGAPAGYLRAESWARLHAPGAPGRDYGLGLVRRPDGTLWHNGSNTLFYAELSIDPTNGVAAAAAANFARAEGGVAVALDAARQEAARA
jgi:CubicO group peptidase (beta-lactamase class C family)